MALGASSGDRHPVHGDQGIGAAQELVEGIGRDNELLHQGEKAGHRIPLSRLGAVAGYVLAQLLEGEWRPHFFSARSFSAAASRNEELSAIACS